MFHQYIKGMMLSDKKKPQKIIIPKSACDTHVLYAALEGVFPQQFRFQNFCIVRSRLLPLLIW